MPVGFEDRKATGSLTAAQGAVTISQPGTSVVYAQVTGTYVGTLTFEASVDEATWVAISATNINSGARATTTTGTGIFAIPAVGRLVRARCSAYTSGTAVVTLSATHGTPDLVSLAGVSGGTGTVVDTELPAAAALGDADPIPTTPTVGAVVMGFVQGGTTVARAKLHDGSLDARGTAINGIVGQSYPYVWSGTAWDRKRGANGASNTTGTGLAGVGPLVWDGTNWQKLKGITDGSLIVVGAAAAGAALAGNPILLGASDGTNAATLLVTSAANPNLRVSLYGTSTQATVTTTGVDTVSSGTGTLQTTGFLHNYNGTNWDRQRSNMDVTLLASAGRTTLQNSGNITTYNCKGIIVTVDVTATVSTVSLTPSINYIDPASGKTIPLLTGTTIAATGTYTYWVNENALASVPAPFTKTAQANLGRTISINIAVGNANSQTYSVGYSLTP